MWLPVGIACTKLKSSHYDTKPAPGIFFCSVPSCMRRLLPLLAQTVCNWPKQTYALFAGEQDRVSEADYIAYRWNSDL